MSKKCVNYEFTKSVQLWEWIITVLKIDKHTINGVPSFAIGKSTCFWQLLKTSKYIMHSHEMDSNWQEAKNSGQCKYPWWHHNYKIPNTEYILLHVYDSIIFWDPKLYRSYRILIRVINRSSGVLILYPNIVGELSRSCNFQQPENIPKVWLYCVPRLNFSVVLTTTLFIIWRAT